MAGGSNPAKAILHALAANFGIAITQSVAAFITGSGAMLAEAIHSYSDCANQGLKSQFPAGKWIFFEPDVTA